MTERADRAQARLAGVLRAAGLPDDRVATRERLDGGTYNAVYRIRLNDGTGLVAKLAPAPEDDILRYEHGILGSEALFYRTVADLGGDVPVPSVVHAGSGTGGDHLLVTELPGTTWYSLRDGIARQERDRLRAELGRYVATLHSVTGDGFGYPGGGLGPARPTWPEAFQEMVEALLADADRFGVTLPRPAKEIRDLFAAHGGVLARVTRPALVHFDLWDGNILVRREPDGHRVSGLIDAERMFWGDPVADFVSLALFGDIQGDEAFLNGYRSAGGKVTFDDSTRRRLALYRAYLYLIMLVEAVPRRFPGPHRDWLRHQLIPPLTAFLDEWDGKDLRP